MQVFFFFSLLSFVQHAKPLFLVFVYRLLFVTVHTTPLLIVTVHTTLLLFVTVHTTALLFVTVHTTLLLFDTVHTTLLLIVTVHTTALLSVTVHTTPLLCDLSNLKTCQYYIILQIHQWHELKQCKLVRLHSSFFIAEQTYHYSPLPFHKINSSRRNYIMT